MDFIIYCLGNFSNYFTLSLLEYLLHAYCYFSLICLWQISFVEAYYILNITHIVLK